MGYILPINNEQYTQYVHRTTPYKTNYLRLHQINPASLTYNQRNYDQQHTEQKSTMKKPSQYVEAVRAQYTGKGLLYNERI
ncbi:hypothetical protein [Bacillus sinesaloumensis]|uniref:hypothetical protein n=1 Tax=Litchfieldia sinesaloumensis TaxID=1926280 RepID=UPI000988557E|nr:hypothetical protein [Bacillus sinesaloumensis]